MRHVIQTLVTLILTFSFTNAQTFQWAKQFGGPSFNSVMFPSLTLSKAITYDDYGNIYTIGTYKVDVDFDPGLDSFMLTSTMGPAENDVFISKLDANGNFVWAKKIGGLALEYATAIVIRNNKDIYITGSISYDTDFDPGPNVFNVTVNNNYYTAYLLKLDTGGNFQWVKTISGTPIGNYYRGANINSLIIDNSGNMLIGGDFNGIADFDPNIGVYNVTASGAYRNAFIAKWDSLGNFIWAKRFGNTKYAGINSLDFDSNDNIYAVGVYQGNIDIDPNTAIYNLDSIGSSDIFILKLDALGNFNWAKSVGGKSFDYSSRIELDNQGNIYLSGSFADSSDFDPSISVKQLKSYGDFDVFVAKYSNSGQLNWVESFGGTGQDLNQGMKLNKLSSNIFLTGSFKDSAIFNSNTNLNMYSNGGYIAYLVNVDSVGDFIWAYNFNRNKSSVNDVNIDPSNNIYLTGSFADTTDFDFSSNVFSLSPIGTYDAFILKMSSNSSSLNHFQTSKSLKFFPNPNSGLFNLNLKDIAIIQITDALGREVYNQKLSAGRHQIQLRLQNNGIYFMKVKTDKAIYSEQIIINH